MKVEFFRHSIKEVDIKKVSEVLRSIFLTTGEVVAEFEKRLASYLGSEDVVGVMSCTAGLHLSLLLVDIKPGDEVITTPMSFCATANAILHAGARPVFVDIEEDTGNINAELIESSINKKTKAILPVHLYGQMCDMVKIKKIADKYGLAVIEDSAHAIEASRNGFKPGMLSDTACFSFYATKSITSGEGGAIATSKKRGEVLRMLRLHGMDKSAADRYTAKYRHWDMPVLGWKYNMDNIQAALLIGQLERIDTMCERRDKIWRTYEEALTGFNDIKIMKTLKDSKHARHLFTVLVKAGKRDFVLHKLQEKAIGVSVNYRPVHLLEYYRKTFGYKEGNFPVAEDIGKRTISLPLYPSLKDNEVSYVIETLKSIIKNY
ncbi:MAG: DegT/DnrJ/EryC1/StrS family aminotransferase [Thermodesulfovibrionales bacterium]